eukprot:gene25526-41439_t
MPSWMVTQAAYALHSLRRAAGPAFEPWLAAALDLEPRDGFPRPGARPDEFAALLLADDAARNKQLFKKHVKAFCGGKKKGQAAHPRCSERCVAGVAVGCGREWWRWAAELPRRRVPPTDPAHTARWLRKCGACGFPNKRQRRYHWSAQALRRKVTGAGRMRTLKATPRQGYS